MIIKILDHSISVDWLIDESANHLGSVSTKNTHPVGHKSYLSSQTKEYVALLIERQFV